MSAAFEAITKVIELAQKKEIDATVSGADQQGIDGRYSGIPKSMPITPIRKITP